MVTQRPVMLLRSRAHVQNQNVRSSAKNNTPLCCNLFRCYMARLLQCQVRAATQSMTPGCMPFLTLPPHFETC
jgi:hypothetical protein